MIPFPEAPHIIEEDLPKPQDFPKFHPFIKGVFSQWHPTQFVIGNLNFACAEQYMMAAKASLFGDASIFANIMDSPDPAVQKRLGMQVARFDEDLWCVWRCHIVYTASLAKFSQNSGCLRQLANTSPAMLVEANSRDWNWGNGLHIDDAANHDPSLWKGTNLLGRILTKVRSELA